jgi:hypothetical protein
LKTRFHRGLDAHDHLSCVKSAGRGRGHATASFGVSFAVTKGKMPLPQPRPARCVFHFA